MTGEHAMLFALTNRGSLKCMVRGYPRVTLFDASGQALPFRYGHGGGSYVSSRKPLTVTLAPGAAGPHRTDPAGDHQLNAFLMLTVAFVSAVRSLLLGGPTGSHVLIPLLWRIGMVAVFAPLTVQRYRRSH
jgi:hypothetical protein